MRLGDWTAATVRLLFKNIAVVIPAPVTCHHTVLSRKKNKVIEIEREMDGLGAKLRVGRLDLELSG